MTLIQVFDALCGKRITRIDFNDGSSVRAPEPALVDLVQSDAPADMWIEASADGLVLHFNAKDATWSMRGESVPLSDIAAVR